MAEDKVVVVGATALARPSFIPADDRRGTENIKRTDLILPRLALAQGLSPELEEGGPKYVEGLKKGDAFNSLTSEVYGKDPIDVVIVRIEDDRFVEFNPLAEGGGVKDFKVPADDPRTQFGPNGEKPVATRFSEFVALRLPGREPIALSFKGSGLAAAKRLKSLVKWYSDLMGGVPAFASVFTLTPTSVTNTKGTFSVFTVKMKPGAITEETYKFASDLYNSWKDQELAVEREPGADDDPKTDF